MDWLKKKKNWLLVVGICAILAFLYMAGCVFRSSVSDPKFAYTDDSVQHSYLYRQTLNGDTLGKALEDSAAWNSMADEDKRRLLLKMYVIQEDMAVALDRAINDSRQETNNNINKINGWLAFWLGIIAVLGIFLPVWNTHRANAEIRGRVDDAVKEMEKQMEREKNELNDRKREWETIKSRGAFRDSLHKLFMDLTGLKLQLENRMAGDSGYRDEILYDTWRHALKVFDEMISQYQTECSGIGSAPSPDGVLVIRHALMILYDMLVMIEIRVPKLIYRNDMVSVRDSIKKVCDSIRCNPSCDVESQLNELARLYGELSRIRSWHV